MPATNVCKTCNLPGIGENYTHAIVWPAQRHMMKKIVNFIQDQGTAFEAEKENGFIVIDTDHSDTFVADLSGALTTVEANDTRVLLFNSKTPPLGAFKDVVSLSHLVDRINSRWLISMLEEQRYVSYAQPIVSADGNWDTVGHEFLLRGHDPDGQLIMPDTLFGAAKDPQLLFNLDRLARICAIETAAKMGGDGDVFVNFLPGSVYDPQVCLRTTVKAAEEHGVAHERIVIEIVESHQIDDTEHLRNIVDFYRSVGFRVALDDFGTGFNNLDMYIALDPDFVKLDKSLTMNLTDDDPRLGMVKGIVRTAHSSKINVIAEGIETANNARVVSDCGVDRMQGYFFGRPAPVQDLAA